MVRSRTLAFVAAGTLSIAACSDDSSTTGDETGTPATSVATDTGTDTTGVADDSSGDDAAAAERCAANEAAGEITVLTSFNYAAAASIIDIVMADQAGYYDDVCLDVAIVPGSSFENYPLVASNQAQFSSGGSFAEVASFAADNDADLTVLGVAGNVPIETLLVKADRATELGDLEGQTIGVQGVIPRPVAAMLEGAGLTDGDNITAVPLAGFDALANLEPDDIAGISGYLSNEVGQLDAAGFDYVAFNPADYGVPGSFGVYYTNDDFASEHPTAVEDFMTATLQGLRDAIADPAAAVEASFAAAEADGNPFFLTPEGEQFRWEAELALVTDSALEPLGRPDAERLETELATYADIGTFGGDPAIVADLIDDDLVAAIYGSASDDDGATSTDGDPSVDSDGAAEPDQVSPTDPLAIVAGEPMPDARCASNRDAGTITFLTGFDYAAAASIIEVIVAETAGYYDEMCLDVDIVAGFSTQNYPLVAGNQAQFASGGSFSETVAFAADNDADLRVVTVAASEPIDTLMIKPEVGDTLADLDGAVIGVKGKLPPSIEVMLNEAGLVADSDYQTVPVDGFDPVAHMSINETAGVPGWRSNEPGRLEREGVAFVQFDAADAGVPGSFGTIFTNGAFLAEHPNAAEDFVRATLRGLHDAIADPEAAAASAIELVDANGNPNFLSADTERFRAVTEADIITAATPSGTAPGTPQPDALQAEIDAYAPTGLFGDGDIPSAQSLLTPLAIGVTDGTDVIWPG